LVMYKWISAIRQLTDNLLVLFIINKINLTNSKKFQLFVNI